MDKRSSWVISVVTFLVGLLALSVVLFLFDSQPTEPRGVALSEGQKINTEEGGFIVTSDGLKPIGNERNLRGLSCG